MAETARQDRRGVNSARSGRLGLKGRALASAAPGDVAPRPHNDRKGQWPLGHVLSHQHWRNAAQPTLSVLPRTGNRETASAFGSKTLTVAVALLPQKPSADVQFACQAIEFDRTVMR